MKKFLFTLAALLMAGSLCAEDYLYISDFEVKQDKLGSTIQVPVKAHFDAYVSAWDLYLTLPEGITVSAWEEGDDLLEIPYVNQSGKQRYLEGSVTTSDKLHYIAITAALTSDHYQVDGEWVPAGCVKWAPGDYEDGMLLITFSIAEDFKGGNIVVVTEPSCGTDKRPEVAANLCPTNPDGTIQHNEKTCVVTVEQTAQAAPAATITNEGNVVTAAVYDNEGNVVERDVELYIVTTDDNGDEVLTKVDNPYNVPQTYEEQKIIFRAKTIANDDESGDTWSEDTEITIPAKEKDYAPTPKINNDGTVVTAAVENDNPEAPHTVVLEYWDATNQKWVEVEDGSYELPAATFETQTIKFRAYTKKNGEYYDSPYCDEVTITIDPKADNQAPAPKFRVEDGKLYAYSEQDLEVVLMLDGEAVPNGYTLPTENTSYTDDIVLNFTAYAKADGVTYNLNSDNAEYQFVLPHLNKNTAQMPTIVRDDANMTETTCNIIITPDPNTDGALTYTANPEAPGAKAVPVTLTYDRKDADYTVHVTAQTLEGTTYQASALAEADIVIPAKPAPNVYETPAPNINVDTDTENQKVIITVTGEGTVTAAVETAEGTKNYTDEDGDGKIVIEIPFGEEADIANVTATALATVVPDGYDAISETPGKDTKSIDIPALPAKTAKPTITYEYGKATWDADGNLVEDGRYATITITNNDEGENVVIEYSLDGGESWLTYNPEQPVTISGEGTYTVMARAQAEGKRVSDPATETIKIDKATSVNELVNGKAVAGVRYFNMAGQEMQEANGITIVVTTYTDGTTSAVKVIK